MAGPNGGYREPNNPAPVSGPGQLSQRTDGGPQQVQADMSGMPYGENAEFNTMQSMAPMSASPSARSPRASARSAKSAGGGMSATPLFAPTQRPDEPVTAGAPFGPGDGPMVMNTSVPSRTTMSSTFRKIANSSNDPKIAKLAYIAEQRGW
jgi:hypothetical protein